MPKSTWILVLLIWVNFAIAQTDTDVPYSANKEFRAAWVATVANINWPSKPGLDTETQKKEALTILDSLAALNFNAVIFQVRPQGDALYESSLEPWSYFLTGEQGKAPKPYYDPLEFWVEEAHKRALELHVWLNPYRIHHISAPKPGKESMVHKLKEAAVYLEEGYWWLDPAQKITQNHTLDVVKDIVLRYDIDGVHFDDYFYPYESYNGGKDFPDEDSWNIYQNEGGLLSRKDWRREAVNTFVRDVYYMIKSYKPFVKFGLSPFGIWRPGYPESIQGMDQYDKLYADAKLWLNQGWVDYFSPQLYWTIAQEAQSYPVLLEWWQSENTHKRHLWPGINAYRATKDERGADEIHSQIMINRAIANAGPGVIHWSVKAIFDNPILMQRLSERIYRTQALVPASDWLTNEPLLEAPELENALREGGYLVSWNEITKDQTKKVVVYTLYGEKWSHKICDIGTKEVELYKSLDGEELKSVQVAFVDRYGREGNRAMIQFIKE